MALRAKDIKRRRTRYIADRVLTSLGVIGTTDEISQGRDRILQYRNQQVHDRKRLDVLLRLALRSMEDGQLGSEQGGGAYPPPAARLLRGKSRATGSGSAHP